VVTSRNVLVIDIGGNNVKMLATGHREPRKVPSGKDFKPKDLINIVKTSLSDWSYDVVAIGFPGPVMDKKPSKEPGNLGSGWVDFDFQESFGKPVRVINDASMQALGAYDGGRMLFLGLGTGLGSTLIDQQVIVPLELGELTHGRAKKQLGAIIGDNGLSRLGVVRWRQMVREITIELKEALLADYVTLGGGNACHLGRLPNWVKRGSNAHAFLGGFRLWEINELTMTKRHAAPPTDKLTGWRLLY
jgi:polyphosphate glucokinase